MCRPHIPLVIEAREGGKISQFLPDQFKEQETKIATTPQRGPEAYLSPEERQFWQRFTSFPEELSPKFRSWLIDFIAVNIPQIPISQIVGFNQVDQVEVSTATVDGSGENTTSGTYVDLTTVGPSLTNLRGGAYILMYGVGVAWAAGTTNAAWMSPSLNSSTPTDANGCQTTTAAGVSIMRAIPHTFTQATGNSIVMKYRTDGGITGNWIYRWLIAQRIGPVPSS